MITVTFAEAVKLKAYVWEHFKVNIHIHNTCDGGLFFTLEEPNEEVTKFLVAYFRARTIDTELSKDLKAIFLGPAPKKEKSEICFKYESDMQRTAAYDHDECIGECTYIIRSNRWVIEHTYVKSMYRHQKIAREMVLLLLEEAKKAGVHVTPQCLYAKRVMEPTM